MYRHLFFAVVILFYPAFSVAQGSTQDSAVQSVPYVQKPLQHHLGTSLFVLMNFLPDPPEMFQLNYGFHLSAKDVLSFEAITWIYRAPLGIPWGNSKGDPSENFPGYVRDVGIGVAYQHFFIKGLYAALHVTPFLQYYINDQDKILQEGFQLFLTLRAGYHITFLKNRLFIEPSIAATFWPINTNMPESFKKMEDKWPSYFLLEPGLHFGVNF